MADLVYSLIWIGGVTFAPFLFFDSLISADLKKRLSESLQSRPDVLDNLPQVATRLLDRVFGESHFSLRCLSASVAASLLFLILMYVLRLLLVLAAHTTADTTATYSYILSELGYPFTSVARTSFAVSLVGNLVFDYLGLLKTRLIIGFLVRRRTSLSLTLGVAIIDFLFSFLVFQLFYIALYFTAFIFIFNPQQTIFLPGGDPQSLLPMTEIMIMLNFATSDAYPAGTTIQFLTHSHAIPIILAFTFVPIFLTSVFFYASVAPSLWLWLFLFAGILSRFLAPAWPAALYVFNFEQSPLKILGLVASALVILIWTFALLVVSLGSNALGILLS
jgi:hypothetical protein